MSSLAGPLKAAIFGGIIVGSASILAEHAQPIPAGLMSTLPVALPAIWFLSMEEIKMTKYAGAFALGISFYAVAAAAFYYLHIKRKMNKGSSLIYAMGVWAVLALTAYFLLR